MSLVLLGFSIEEAKLVMLRAKFHERFERTPDVWKELVVPDTSARVAMLVGILPIAREWVECNCPDHPAKAVLRGAWH